MLEYDYIIIGAGPSGITLAWCLAQYKKKILLIDRESDIGGCHRVRRVDGMFTEHGPRIYLNNYKTLMLILDDMGLDFYDLFTKYNFNISQIGGKSIYNIKFLDLLSLGYGYIKSSFNNSWSKSMTVGEFAQNFDSMSIDYLDRLTRLTDGAGINRYTLFEFFELLNQNTFYTIYQPKLPNDVGLFKLMKEKLTQTGYIDILLDSEVTEIKENGKIIINKTDEKIGRNIVLAMPPRNILNILNSGSNKIKNAFGNSGKLEQYVNNTEYFTYIPITFHWHTKLDLPKKWGFPSTDWGIAYVVMSDYMDFNDDRSKTVISTCITYPDKKSNYTNKTANHSSISEIKEEVFRQLKLSYPNLLNADHVIVSPGIYYDTVSRKWLSHDVSFVYTKDGSLDSHSTTIQNLYNLGTQNGHSNYSFTSMESAMSNAVNLLHELIPESKIKYKVGSIITLNKIVSIIFIILCISILLLLFKSLWK